MDTGIAPANIISNLKVPRPIKINSPNPPAPMADAIVAVPKFIMAAFLIPEKIVGNAFGISTCHKICLLVIPMPLAASIILLSMPKSPDAVLKVIGTILYKNRAKIAGAGPIPMNKKTIAITAILGTAWAIPVIERAILPLFSLPGRVT